MICSSCGTENTPGAKFCNECGATLAAACPTCGAVNRPGAKFCNECGTTLAGAPPWQSPAGAPAAASTAERRLVTVLFADIVGFTPFAEERDAEDVRDTLTRYFDLCSELIGRYGGTVEKFIGDAVMAVWGTPVAHEDDAERAVRAALELVDGVGSLGPGIQARAGVLTGEAAVSLGAANQGMVAGDMVNTAARLQSAAPAGSVLVGEATMRATSGSIVYEEAGEQALKGKQAPVAAWRALRIVAERGGRNRSEALEAPFIGRSDELRLLKDLYHATGREKKIRLVSVMGPGGIGKSRLAWEFVKYVDGLVEDTYWHDGRSPAYGEGITFWALGEMVRGRCGLAEGDDEATTRSKVGEAVRHWLSDTEEIEWVERSLLALLGLESGMAPEQLFAAWRTFFERIAERGTVALVFEDMHHADSGLLDFIDHMLEWSRGLPIYIITLARPELLERRPTWGAGKRSFTSLYLEPLGEEEMRELIGGLVPGLPESATLAIIGRADGIPLYAVETVRMLVNDGRLREEAGVYVPAGDLSELAVPETLTALISSRLDALGNADRSLIQDAAVLGQSFSLASLAAVSGVAPGELTERLDSLVRRELLNRQVDPRSPEEGQYLFVQALIREVAYNTLAHKDRKERHMAAARYFDQLGSDELASALASHYLAAHKNAAPGAEADALAAQARVALRAAADRAASLGAHGQAVALIEQALTVTPEPAGQAEQLERAARSAMIASLTEDAADYARRALELRRQTGDRPGTARAVAALGLALISGRRINEALEALEAGHSEFADLWPDPVIAELKAHLARALFEEADYTRSLTLLDETLEVAEHANEPTLLAQALISKGAVLGARGRLREGIALIRAGEEVAREHSDTELVLSGLVVRGYHLGEVDNAQALACYREGLALARRAGHRLIALRFINNVGYTGFLDGEWEEALRELDGALAEEIEPASRLWLWSNELIIRANRGEEIAQQLADLDRLAAEVDDPRSFEAVADARANAAQAAGDLDEAQRQWLSFVSSTQAPACYYQAARPAAWAADLDAVRSCSERLDATGFHGPVVEARRAALRATIAALEGRAREATRLYEEALAGWRELKVTWEEALTGLDMATLLDPAQPEVAAVVRSTREILTRLGARPYLERLEAAVAGRSGTARAGAARPSGSAVGEPA